MPRWVLYSYMVPLCLSAIFSLKTFRLKWPAPYRSFAIFLWLTLLSEGLAISWKLGLHKTEWWSFSRSNAWIYNLYFIPEYLFYCWFFNSILDQPQFKRSFKYVFGTYLVLTVSNLLFFQGFNQLNTYNIIAGNLLVVIYSSGYFLGELNRKQPERVSNTPLFWLSLGAFIFFTVSIPYFISINYLSRTNLPLAIALFNILLSLNVLMYSFYLIAFLCRHPFHKKPTSPS